MAVYIFPVDWNLDVHDIHDRVKGKGLKIMVDSYHEYREEKGKIYKGLEDGIEETIGDSEIFVDSELPFITDDIVDYWSFGNGTTKGSIRLKDGRSIKCGWVVIDHADVNVANGMLTALKDIFKEKP